MKLLTEMQIGSALAAFPCVLDYYLWYNRHERPLTDTNKNGNANGADALQRRWPQMIFTDFCFTYLRSFVSISILCVLQFLFAR